MLMGNVQTANPCAGRWRPAVCSTPGSLLWCGRKVSLRQWAPAIDLWGFLPLVNSRLMVAP